MHKYFAKPLFLGKKVEYLTECHSTNDELNERIKKGDIKEGFLIYTDHQLSGRGQRGNAWISEPGKNLLFSIFIEPKFLQARQAYLLNIISGLAVMRVLGQTLETNDLSLKWPNDTYVADRKIGGILVETSIENSMIAGAVIGLGFNVNQDHFALHSATSLKMETNKSHDREEVLESFLIALEHYLLKLRAGNKDQLLNEYYRFLRWRGEIHTFRSGDSTFEAEIIGVNETGKLIVNANNIVKTFDVKEIEFLY